MLYALVVLCACHYPYHNYAYTPYVYPNYNFGYWFYLPPLTDGSGFSKPQPVDACLADLGWRMKYLGDLANKTTDKDLRRRYLSAKRELELRRLEYLGGQSEQQWPGYGYPR